MWGRPSLTILNFELIYLNFKLVISKTNKKQLLLQFRPILIVSERYKRHLGSTILNFYFWHSNLQLVTTKTNKQQFGFKSRPTFAVSVRYKCHFRSAILNFVFLTAFSKSANPNTLYWSLLFFKNNQSFSRTFTFYNLQYNLQ